MTTAKRHMNETREIAPITETKNIESVGPSFFPPLPSASFHVCSLFLKSPVKILIKLSEHQWIELLELEYQCQGLSILRMMKLSITFAEYQTQTESLYALSPKSTQKQPPLSEHTRIKKIFHRFHHTF